MAITALNTAATGLKALSSRIDVIANNLANAETTAFKRQRMNFEDLMYLTKRHPGALNSTGAPAPAGIQIGLGVKVSNTQLDLQEGSLEKTDLPLDVAIIGSGFFKVEVAEGFGDGVAFTRNGNFFRNNDGDLVLGIGDGYRLEPGINIPADVPANTITISENGRVTGLQPGNIEPTEFGQLELVRFVNPQGLRLLGGSLYMETEASGQALPSEPGEEGAGSIRQGFLEGSNVDPTKELVSLIKTQRNFELNSQSIQTADQALQTIGNLRRF